MTHEKSQEKKKNGEMNKKKIIQLSINNCCLWKLHLHKLVASPVVACVWVSAPFFDHFVFFFIFIVCHYCKRLACSHFDIDINAIIRVCFGKSTCICSYSPSLCLCLCLSLCFCSYVCVCVRVGFCRRSTGDATIDLKKSIAKWTI